MAEGGKRGGGLTRYYAECAKEGKGQGLRGQELVEFVGRCLLRKSGQDGQS